MSGGAAASGRGPGLAPVSGAAWRVLAAAALGALQTWALVSTTLWWLPLLCIATLAGLWRTATPALAGILGWAYGSAWLLATVWWLFISMHQYGGLAAPLAGAAVALLCAALSLYLGGALAWAARQRCGGLMADGLRFAGAWLGAELARAVWFTGFPWGAVGYTQVDGPLAALAPWLGVYGIGAVLAWAAALLGLTAAAWWAQRPGTVPAHAAESAAARAPAPGAAAAATRWAAPLVLALVLLGLPAVVGRVEFSQPAGALTVALLQPNVAQDEKFAAERLPDTLAWVARAMLAADATLVVAPETAVPLLPDQLQDLAPGYWAQLQQHFGRPGGPAALVGVPLGSERLGYTNSVLGLSAAAPAPAASAADGTPAGYRYDKTHLVPFGEFIPTGFRWFTELMNIPLGDFNRGPLAAPSFAVGAQRVAPNICYEDLFGEELARRFVDPATAPTLLANVSNIGWFGPTTAVPQHLVISRLRSLELQRPMVRATNTGATAIIDHRGVVTATLPPFTTGVLTGPVEGRSGLTPFVRWASVAGLWPLWALVVLALAWPRTGAGRGAR